jgi:hypothetical protein
MSEQFNANNVQEELSEQQLQDIAGGKTTKIVFEEPKPLSPEDQKIVDAAVKQILGAIGGPINSVFPNNPPGGSSTTGGGSSTAGGGSNPTN